MRPTTIQLRSSLSVVQLPVLAAVSYTHLDVYKRQVYDQQNVTILEIMGRNAGWLTGAAALAKCEDCEGPDMIFLPEVTFDVDEFMKKVAELHKKKKSVVVAVSEGVKTADGRYVCELTNGIEFVDAFGHKQLTGTARFLAEKINREVGCKTRAIEFNSLQRCASHIAVSYTHLRFPANAEFG